MTEKNEIISEEGEMDESQMRTKALEKFNETIESLAYIKTPLSKELCIISILTHVGSDFDKCYKISDEVKAIEKVENNVRHASFYATKDNMKKIDKLVTITCAAGTSTRGYTGVWRRFKCRGRTCDERCVDCQASINRCYDKGDPGCSTFIVCYRDPNC